jgi:hypothetical protein
VGAPLTTDPLIQPAAALQQTSKSDIPEEFYLMMAQDMLLRHRGDVTDEVVRVLPRATGMTSEWPQ